MKNLFQRSISGSVFMIIVTGSILLGPNYFTPLVFIFTIIGLFELLSFSKHLKQSSLEKGIIVVAAIFIFLSFRLNYSGIISTNYQYLSLIGIFPVILLVLFSKYKRPLESIATMIFALVYIALPFALMTTFYFLNNIGVQSYEVLIGFFIILWFNDVFAYLVGSLIGKHKLFERVSPKKTWEGTIGGIILSIISAFLISYYFHSLDLNNWLALGLIISIFATLGDLVESLLKRQAGIKDSGNIMPGHGGILDRFDGAIFAIPAVYIYLIIIFS